MYLINKYLPNNYQIKNNEHRKINLSLHAINVAQAINIRFVDDQKLINVVIFCTPFNYDLHTLCLSTKLF